MKKKLITFAVAAFVALVIAAPVMAAEYERIVLSGALSATSSNTAAFYNAQILGVRMQNSLGVGITNTWSLTQVSANGQLTNTIASGTTTTNVAYDVEAGQFIQLRNDRYVAAGTSNFVIEVILDNRSR
jgi:hypothetical protein